MELDVPLTVRRGCKKTDLQCLQIVKGLPVNLFRASSYSSHVPFKGSLASNRQVKALWGFWTLVLWWHWSYHKMFSHHFHIFRIDNSQLRSWPLDFRHATFIGDRCGSTSRGRYLNERRSILMSREPIDVFIIILNTESEWGLGNRIVGVNLPKLWKVRRHDSDLDRVYSSVQRYIHRQKLEFGTKEA